jgi:hypothetical protein
VNLAGRAWRALVEAEPLLLLARSSLLLVMVNSNDDAPAFLALAATCVVAIARRRILLSPWLWAAAFAGLGIRHLSDWHGLDDHIVASAYWCGAMALALSARLPLPTLAAAARLLIGSLFAFAAAWKLGSGEFMDGRFFRYSLVFDDRFRTVAEVVGGTTDVMDAANHQALQGLVDADEPGQAITLREGTRNVPVAWVFTIWGALVEAAVAVTFLVPLRRRWGWLRHAALIAFAATAYVIVPIGGFGALLLVLAAATVETERARATYLAASLVLAAWAGIWPVIFL